MILKSYGWKYGVWFGGGTQSLRQPFITKTWLTTVLPPYLRGVGVNFSIGTRSIRIGVYKAIAGCVSDDYDNVDVEGELSVLGWKLEDTTTEVITTWVSSEPSETTTSEQSESKQPPAPPAGVPETAPGDSTTPPCSTGPSPSP